MEIKDVNIAATDLASKAKDPASSQPQDHIIIRPRSQNDSAVNVDAQGKPSALLKTRKAANEIVNTINLVVDATGEIDRLVKSIDGIVKQASKGDVPEKRLAVLEKEANQILDAIKRRVDDTHTAHGNPLVGDAVTLSTDKDIIATLDVKLPNHAKDIFGLRKVDFSKKDSISESRSTIEKAQTQVNDLKSKVHESRNAIHQTVAALDVALQNTEASSASVRDLDQALRLAGNTKFNINSDPAGAIGSLDKLGRQALDLLK